MFGVSSKAVRDVWNLRSWALTTKPYWSQQDREKYDSSLRKAQESAALAYTVSPSNTRASPSETPLAFEEGDPRSVACVIEDDTGCVPPPKSQRASSTVRAAWSDLVRVSATASFEGATEMLCSINPSYSRLHLFDQASGTEFLHCSLDGVTLRMCNEPG